ncbi:hypothetical protein K8D42_10445 [Citrobacter portucalensis]|nr:hypothetical protein [Citrobacter portucalensis]MCO4135731.1 hypothetical protein [Citrobacter portucalensis]MCO4154326.1 hypothetical protein [Citrobacter portucalensis]
MFSEYRTRRCASGRAPKTVNNELRYLNSIFNKLIELGLFHSKNPLKGLSELKLPQSELGYLTEQQTLMILDQLYDDNLLVAQLCLSTGARRSEAAKL